MPATSVFARVWGESEEKYSRVLAQTLELSAGFRSLFLQKVSDIQSLSGIARHQLRVAAECSVTVKPEAHLGEFGRIDLLLNYGALNIGIENKKAAELQENQLSRYEECLESLQLPYLLLFLAPSTYPRVGNDLKKQDQFAQIDYTQVRDWTTEYLRNHNLSQFEHRYFKEFLIFTAELEMKPFSNEEVSVLSTLRVACEARDKAVWIVSDLAKPSGNKLENHAEKMGFVLACIGDIAESLPVYAGFRFFVDETGYFDAPLLRGPEVLAYVTEVKRSQQGNRAYSLLKQVANSPDLIKSDPRLEYFPATSPGKQSVLAIRKPLAEFVGKESTEILNWLLDATAQLHKIQRCIAQMKSGPNS
jgi:hypothetical protein